MGGKQRGFSVVEVVLIFVIIGILGFTGWFVWNSQKKINATLDDSSKGSSTVVATKKAITPTTNNSTQTPTSNYLTIKEWAVKFEIPSSIKNMSYSILNGAVWFESSDLSSLAGGTKCSLGLMERVDPSSTMETGAVKIKHVGNYDYWYGGPQQACLPESTATMTTVKTSDYPSSALQTKVVDAMPNLLKTTLVAE